ncbi:3-oxoadipyl-CoA/3-oxo-5,6-dehydrosuberyl-CoA thiolase [Carnimonas sp. R-84981]|uniref:3-oxoadipyl-CoA thiolase n=1 Tax=Carnimonas bestiolae TaxID=3402172 RepID=UPI003EDBA457
MSDAYIYSGIRTPFGRYGGSLSSVRPDDLMAQLIAELVQRHHLDGSEIEDVLLGNANQAGEDSRNIARHAALLSGLPDSVPGMTVNRLCASGLAAVIDAGRAIKSNEGELFIAGGVESMSRAPWVMPKADTAFSRHNTLYDSTIGARFPNPRITADYGDDTMPKTADNVASDFDIGREDTDRYAYASQQRYAKALAAGFFNDEIHPVTIPAKRKTPAYQVSDDEHPRPDTSLEALAKLRTVFVGGVVTAGNASGVNDGAAALLVGAVGVQERLERRPIARIVAAAAAGVPPRIMGIGPVPAIHKALQRANLTLNDMDVIEINEAFSAQVLGCLKALGLAFDDPRVNPNGGAIAIGHPLGASGARLALTGARQLHAINGRYAVISLCIGVGQGLAMVIEREE